MTAMLATAVVAGALAGAPGASGAGPGPEFFSNGVNIGSTPQNVLGWGKITFQTSALGLGKVNCFGTIQGTVSNGNGVGLGELGGFAMKQCETKEPAYEYLCPKELTYCLAHPGPAFVTAEMPLKLSPRVAEVCKEESKSPAECPAESEREVRTLYSRYARRPSSLPWTLQLEHGERREEEGVLVKLGAGLNCYPKETAIVEGKEVEEAANWESVPSGCVKLNVVYPEVPLEFPYYGALEIWMINGVHNGLSPSKLEFVSPSGSLEGGQILGEKNTQGNLSGKVFFVGEPHLELLTAK